ncbi:MAG: ATP-binding protein [Deltaproteobacteria bacterium]|nr:ATP-binding protein [Deltaproteobacteria bacterium]
MADHNSSGPGRAPIALCDEGSGVFVRGRGQWQDAVVYAIHDARNHVMSILASVDFLQHASTRTLSDPEVIQELGCVKAAGKQLALLLSEALASGRHAPHEVVGCNQQLAQILDESAARLHRYAALRRGVTMEVRHGPRSVMIADATLLRRVLDNLLLSAIEHAPSGSVVDVSWSIEDDRLTVRIVDPGWTSDRAAGNGARVREVPEGASLPEADRDGLGFAFCRAVARAYGGELRFGDPGPGGAVVSFCLPIPDQTEAANEQMAAAL